MNKKAYGFTIVELLIVIVVIAILAAITVVAYNGIQKRAATQLYNSSADAIEKSLRASATTDKAAFINAVIAYDGQDSMESGVAVFCAAKTADLPARDGFAQGECFTDSDGKSYMANDALFDALLNSGVAPYRSKAFTPVQIDTSTDYSARSRAPFMIVSSNSNLSYVGGTILWFTPDQSSCGRGEGVVKIYYEAAKRVIEDGASIVEEFGSRMTLEQVQFIYDTYGSTGDQCIVSFEL